VEPGDGVEGPGGPAAERPLDRLDVQRAGRDPRGRQPVPLAPGHGQPVLLGGVRQGRVDGARVGFVAQEGDLQLAVARVEHVWRERFERHHPCELAGCADEGVDVEPERRLQRRLDPRLEVIGLVRREGHVAAGEERADLAEPERLERGAQLRARDTAATDVDATQERDRLLREPLVGRNAWFEVARSGLPIVLFLSSAGLALLIGEWAVLFWVAIWPLDAVLARLQRRP
jgi:hypothetical protein